MTDYEENLDVGLEKVFDSFFSKKHFCMPAQVIKFNSSEHTVNVQPAFKTLTSDSDIPKLLPVIEDVPVVYPGGGAFFVTFDIVPGHFVLLVFAERSLENWANLGGIADPQSTRKCHLSDAIAIPGVLPLPVASTVSVDSNSIAIRDLANTIYVKVSATNVEIKAGLGIVTLNATTGQADINGNLTVDV